MSQAGKSRGPYRTGIDRRKQIIATAANVFAVHGFRGGSLRQIALEVGVTPAALGRHFESKEDLLIGVLEWWETQTDLAVRDDVHGVQYFVELRSIMEYHVTHRGVLELFLTLSVEASSPDHPAADFIRERYRSTATKFAGELLTASARGEVIAMTPVEAESESRMLMAVMDGLEIQWILDPSIGLVELYDRHVEHLLARWRTEKP